MSQPSNPPKLKDKTLINLESALTLGDFYQAHQIYRSLCNRYLKQKNFGKAIKLLYEGSLKLLENEQFTSAADLGTYLTKTYMVSDTRVDSESAARVLDIIKAFPSTEKSREFLIASALDWMVKLGSLKSGEPLFHDALAAIYERDNDFLMTENHYLYGTEETSEAFARFIFNWASMVEPVDFGYFLARPVLSMIAAGNATKAALTTQSFISELAKHKPNLVSVDAVLDANQTGKAFVEFNLPLLNFIQLLVLLLPKAGAQNVFSQLRKRYEAHLVTPAYNFSEVLDKIGEDYFGLRVERPVNLLQTLMSSMFNSGGDSHPNAALPFNQLAPSNHELD